MKSLVILFILLYASIAFGADIWYMREDGTATQAYGKNNGDPDNASRCMGVSDFNAGPSIYTEGAIIYLSSNGGNFTSTLTTPYSYDRAILLTSAPGDYASIVSASGAGIVVERNNHTISNMSIEGANYSLWDVLSSGTLTLDNVTLLNSPTYGFILAASSTVVMSNCNIYNINGANSAGFYLAAAGNAVVTDTIIHNSFRGVLAIGTSTSTFTRCKLYANIGNGFQGGGSNVTTFTDSEAFINFGDGFHNAETTATTLINCKSYNNGLNALYSASGDGYTSHDTSEMNLYNCIAFGNTKSGAGMTGSSFGNIYNSTFYNNFDDSYTHFWTTEGGMGIGINSDGNWNIKNNICSNNGAEIVFTALATGTIVSDYNVLNNSRGSAYGYQWAGTEYATLALYQTPSSQDANSRSTDPNFYNAPLDLLWTVPPSPANNGGVSIVSYGDRIEVDSVWTGSVSVVADPLMIGAFVLGTFRGYESTFGNLVTPSNNNTSTNGFLINPDQ